MDGHTLLPREVPLGGPRGLLVRRTLPHRAIRTIGTWCFADHYGPVAGEPMVVAPHPHLGLQTASWLLAGRIEHRDSVGGRATVRPGELSLMTAGHGIAHSEYSDGGPLLGVQLWIALPDAHRGQAPHFEHHADLPRVDLGAARGTLLLGSWAGATSPAAAYAPIVGVEIVLTGTARLPLDRGFEHGVLVADGDAAVDGQPVPFGGLRYLPPGREAATVSSAGGAVLLLLGGQPLAEDLLMWWNFVGRDHEEILRAREDWEAGRRFGAVVGDGRPGIPAPPLPAVRMLPRPNRP